MKGRLSVAMAVAVLIALFVGSSYAEAKKETGKKEYVGSETCKKCHKIQYESWKETYHSKMVRKPSEGILKAVVEKWATDGATPGRPPETSPGSRSRWRTWSTSSAPTGSSGSW